MKGSEGNGEGVAMAGSLEGFRRQDADRPAIDHGITRLVGRHLAYGRVKKGAVPDLHGDG